MTWGRRVMSAVAALVTALLTVALLTYGAPTAESEARDTVPAGAQARICEEADRQEDEVVLFRTPGRRDITAAALRESPYRTAVQHASTLPATTNATGPGGPPYGVRGKTGGDLPAVLQVFRC